MSAQVQTIGPAPLDPHAEQVEIRMRDGVRLATDVYLGDDTGDHARAHRLPAPARPPPPPAPREQRLSPLHLAPRHRGQPLSATYV